MRATADPQRSPTLFFGIPISTGASASYRRCQRARRLWQTSSSRFPNSLIWWSCERWQLPSRPNESHASRKGRGDGCGDKIRYGARVSPCATLAKSMASNSFTDGDFEEDDFRPRRGGSGLNIHCGTGKWPFCNPHADGPRFALVARVVDDFAINVPLPGSPAVWLWRRRLRAPLSNGSRCNYLNPVWSEEYAAEDPPRISTIASYRRAAR